MRILIATQHLDIVGGLETHLRAVLPLLSDAGHSLLVVAENTTTDPRRGILQNCPETPVLHAADAGLLEAVSKWAPDLVYQHGVASADLEASLAERYPSILYAHGYYGTCISGSKSHAWPNRTTCDRVLGPACLALYPVRRCGGRDPRRMLSLYSVQRSHQQALFTHRKILVASRHMAAEYRRHGVRNDRLQILAQYPPDVVPDAEAPGNRAQSGRVLFTGRITKHKGLDLLIDAIPIASDALDRPLTLVVAGDGPERASAERQAARGRSPVQFLGWLSSERRNAEMRAADLLVIPSVWPEPFGLVGIEAGCVGTPAVGYAVGGIPDWLVPGRSGELADSGRLDAPNLAAAVRRALESEAHWKLLCRGAWDIAREFSRARHSLALLSMLDEVAGQREPSSSTTGDQHVPTP